VRDARGAGSERGQAAGMMAGSGDGTLQTPRLIPDQTWPLPLFIQNKPCGDGRLFVTLLRQVQGCLSVSLLK